MRKSTNMVNIKTFQTQTIGLVFEISEHLPQWSHRKKICLLGLLPGRTQSKRVEYGNYPWSKVS